MKAIELIGKKAIRTAPTKTCGDYSYTDTPLLILKATDTHIVYQHCNDFEVKMFGTEPRILRCDYCDDNWTDYDELINVTNEKEK